MATLLRVSASRTVFTLGILCAGISASAQSGTKVIYQGISHTPIGNAILRADSERRALDVRTADPNGGDGVAAHLGASTTEWEAYVETANDGLPLLMTLNAVADGQRISTAVMREVDDRIVLAAGFTGGTKSTYAVLVYNNGKLMDSLGGLPPTAQIYIPHSMPCEFFENGCSFTQKFRNAVNGECEWGFVFERSGRITLPNGRRVTGNEVRLLEEVHPAGHYPYLSFDGLTLQTNARRLTLLSERMR